MANQPNSDPSKRKAGKAGHTPGTRIGVNSRAALAEVYDQRGHTQGKLWMQYSGKNRADIAFPSERAYLHFLHIESSPDVVKVDYTPAFKVARAIGDSFVHLVDTELVMADGDVVWRCACDDDQAAEITQAHVQLDLLLRHVKMPDGLPTPRLEVLTQSRMLENPERIRNWHGIAGWLCAGRDWDLSDYQSKVNALIRREGPVEFQKVLSLGGGTEHDDLYGVAVLEGLQRGVYRSNLYETPFTLRSVFSATRGAA